jgi:hypothetical protein
MWRSSTATCVGVRAWWHVARSPPTRVYEFGQHQSAHGLYSCTGWLSVQASATQSSLELHVHTGCRCNLDIGNLAACRCNLDIGNLAACLPACLSACNNGILQRNADRGGRRVGKLLCTGVVWCRTVHGRLCESGRELHRPRSRDCCAQQYRCPPPQQQSRRQHTHRCLPLCHGGRLSQRPKKGVHFSQTQKTRPVCDDP